MRLTIIFFCLARHIAKEKQHDSFYLFVDVKEEKNSIHSGYIRHFSNSRIYNHNRNASSVKSTVNVFCSFKVELSRTHCCGSFKTIACVNPVPTTPNDTREFHSDKYFRIVEINNSHDEEIVSKQK